jgi:uncharacterized lipoprotein YddW (UPF0748 family)
MERMNTTTETDPRHGAPANSYDAVPRDGPAVFVADAAAWDRGEIRGVWVDAQTPPARVVQQLAEELGREVGLDELAVVDQVGLGAAALSEDYFSDEHAVRSGVGELTD